MFGEAWKFQPEKMKLRKAHLLLHRKEWRSKQCICGSDMTCTGQGWVCRRQIRLKEPKAIEVHLTDKRVRG